MAQDVLSNLTYERSSSRDGFNQARQFLCKRGLLPSPECIAHRVDIFDRFCRVVLGKDARHIAYQLTKTSVASSQYLLEKEDNVKFVIVPVGSYAIGVWNSHDPVVCVCFGSTNVEEFSNLVDGNLRLCQTENVKQVLDKDAESLTLDASVDGVSVKLEYCYLGAYFMAKWEELSQTTDEESVSLIPSRAAVPLNIFREGRKIAESISDLDSFVLVYRLLELWARLRGIYHTSLGYLDRQILILLLYRFWKDNQDEYSSLHSVLVGFFTYYCSSVNWRKDVIGDLSNSGVAISSSQLRTKQNPVVVISLYSPVRNAASHVTEQSLRVILAEFKEANRLLEAYPTTWAAILSLQELEMAEDAPFMDPKSFIHTFRIFVRVEFRYWGSDMAGKVRFLNQMKKHYSMLIERLSRTNFRRFISRAEKSIVFAWPYRLLQMLTAKEEETYCYLVGIDNRGDATGYQSFLVELQDECAEISADFLRDHVFNPLTSFANIAVVNKTGLGELTVDPLELLHEKCLSQRVLSTEDGRTSPEKSVVPNDSVAHKKFRSASEVLNRLIWDPHFDRSDYIIGYLDRFLGVLEISLDSWKADSTDQDFIPQHRILYFKRRSDNTVIWDRKNRIDRIFDNEDILP